MKLDFKRGGGKSYRHEHNELLYSFVGHYSHVYICTVQLLELVLAMRVNAQLIPD
jgi:hypothetical protein